MSKYVEFSADVGLTNKVVIKAALGEDIRKFPIQNGDITYDELLRMMRRIFKGKLSAADDVIIKYKDKKGDLITIADSSDLAFAVQCRRVLKITLYVNGQPHPTEAELIHMMTQMQNVIDKATHVLDKMEQMVNTIVGNGVELSGGKAAENVVKASQPAKIPAVDESNQFDPLGQQYRPTAGNQERPERTMGGQHAYISSNESRPDNANSTSSASHPPSGQAGQHQAGLVEENVATIQTHQQGNAGDPTQAAAIVRPTPQPRYKLFDIYGPTIKDAILRAKSELVSHRERQFLTLRRNSSNEATTMFFLNKHFDIFEEAAMNPIGEHRTIDDRVSYYWIKLQGKLGPVIRNMMQKVIIDCEDDDE